MDIFSLLTKRNYPENTIGWLANFFDIKLPKGMSPKTPFSKVFLEAKDVTEDDVFIVTDNNPDEEMINDILEKGVVAVFCSRGVKESFPDEHVIALDNPHLAAQKYEIYKHSRLSAKCIAITGSYGKTTTCSLINSVISKNYKTFASNGIATDHEGILNNLQALGPDIEYWIQEVEGINPGDVEAVAEFLNPDIVVLTNIGNSHLDTYFSTENILFDKASLERFAKPDAAVIISYDDEILMDAYYKHNVITCSICDSRAHYYAKDIIKNESGIKFTAVTYEEGEYPVSINFTDKVNVYNALFAIAVGQVLEIDIEDIIETLKVLH